ncbi:MAG: tRNA pseudouridine(55) synthase TruB [Methylococcales bacterium]|nr:tRNA pseudouridine(55) synthase TruB [Methylococcaceae bacterium]
MSKRKSGRNIHGIILLDKRLEASSNRALQEVRRLFNANKAGHTGSLDPMATGLLPLCFGEATKVSAMMLDDDKRYQVVAKLGVMTDTGDVEGKVIAEKPVPKLDSSLIKQCLQGFMGQIEQVPPMYSALKHNGRKLYELAREGKVIERKARKITIFELELLQFTEATLTLDVMCSKGTYIRSLVEDIGHQLGCGASVLELRRTQAGQFKIEDAFTLEQLQAMDSKALNSCLLKVDKPLESLPLIALSATQAGLIKQGQKIQTEQPSTHQNMVRMYSEHVFLGLGELLLDGKLVPKRIFNLDADVVSALEL